MKNALSLHLLNSGETLEQFCERNSVKATRHHRYPHLVGLKYRRDNFDDPLTLMCRGIILDEANDWNVVAWPYNKFFNAHDPRAASIDWGSAVVYEKLDGTLCTLYAYNGEWHVATTGDPAAQGRVNGANVTFEELFWRTFRALGYKLVAESPPLGYPWCDMFELCCPENRVVVNYSTPRIVWHGYRNVDPDPHVSDAGREGCIYRDGPQNHEEMGWEWAKSWVATSLEEVQAYVESIEGSVGEGFVVCDADFNRIKVKAPSYVRLHNAASHGATDKGILEMVLNGEANEFGLHFPEERPRLADMKARLSALETLCAEALAAREGITDQKEFALSVRDLPHRAALFALRSGKAATVEEWCQSQRAESVLRLLEGVLL